MPSQNVNPDLAYVVYSAALTWLMVMTASLLRARAWTPKGLVVAFGNRDDLPAPTPLTGRADRAAWNMLENMVLLTAVLLAARVGGADARQVAPGAALFFWARVAYFPVYLAGIPYLRSALWGVSVAGLVIIVRAAL